MWENLVFYPKNVVGTSLGQVTRDNAYEVFKESTLLQLGAVLALDVVVSCYYVNFFPLKRKIVLGQ